MRATTPLDADAARLHQKRTLVADVAEELAAFRQRRGRWLRDLRERIAARAELPPRRLECSTRGAKHHCVSLLLAGLQRPCSCFTSLFTPVTLRAPGIRRTYSANWRRLACNSPLASSVLVQTDGWARGEREGYGEPCDVTTSASASFSQRRDPLRRRRGHIPTGRSNYN